MWHQLHHISASVIDGTFFSSSASVRFKVFIVLSNLVPHALSCRVDHFIFRPRFNLSIASCERKLEFALVVTMVAASMLF